MNRMRTVLAALGITAGLISAPAASAAPGPARPAPAAERHEPCTGEFRGDARLGPKWLPNKRLAPVGPLLKGWQRTGDLTPNDFLKKYWEGPADTGKLEVPAQRRLRRGERRDRQGAREAPHRPAPGPLRLGVRRLPRPGRSDAYAERALPPQNLNTRDAATPCDYRVYKVAKPFWVWQGGIAPWFEQPGGGQQIKLDAVFLNPSEGQRLNVKWLLDNAYLTPAGA